MSEFVITRREGAILHLRLDRVNKKNALTQDMYQALLDGLNEAEADDSIHAVVFSAEGDTFCAGNDLGDFLRHGELTPQAPVFQLLKRLPQLTVPLVASVQGMAIGIGTTLLLHCDLIYAAEDAVFALPFVDLALVPEAGSSLLLPQTVGYPKAAELLLLGEPFNAEQALQMGLLNGVVTNARLQAVTAEVAAKLAAKPPQALRRSKALLKQPVESTSARIDRELEVFMQALASDEAQRVIAEKAAGKATTNKAR
ncbi:enoyl-CoA hydratase-related protein [Aliidiomarina soli]|uniref:Enoyl-CoA hydratase n=1 Tax=Aliidiomarina soli TaxID=1928574 RepID=A0A432WGX8_9GAMM|nr:enoyl-CoA hydratase-related protein [Aliidiomarina soli]RUO32991.1 enoyl-CoA hydratase [Aliidiomarina soli]